MSNDQLFRIVSPWPSVTTKDIGSEARGLQASCVSSTYVRARVETKSTPGVRTIRGMRTTQDIVDSIEIRLRELNQEIQTLTAARSALETDDARPSTPVAPVAAAPAARPARPARRRSRRRARGAAATEVIPAGRLELLLSENGGLTTSVLAERTNGDRDQVLTLLRELEAAGRVRRSGQRRSTRWHAITDEDRIQARAAELAGRRRREA